MSDGKSSSVWSPEEDAELARLQEIHGNRWALVAAELPGKTGQQCAQRWRHKVNPAIKKEKWTSGRSDLNRGTVSKKRGVGSVLGAPVAKRRRSAMEKGNNKGGNQSDTSSSGSGYGNGGGLDLLAMLYSAAVTYETSVVAAGAGMKSFPPELYA